MPQPRPSILTLGASLAIAICPALVAAQVDQRRLAQDLLAEDLAVRSTAVNTARAIGPPKLGPDVRQALITLLERQNRLVAEATGRQAPVADLENPELIATVSRLVAELAEPAAIPALAQAIYGGVTVSRALAAFGEEAAPAVLSVVTTPSTHYSLVDHGLRTLRFMVEGAALRPLSPATLLRIRLAAEQRLTGTQYFTTLWQAIDLAVALNDPGLRRTVEELASNDSAVIARGVTDQLLVERTRMRAAQRLAGIPPMPRWSPR